MWLISEMGSNDLVYTIEERISINDKTIDLLQHGDPNITPVYTWLHSGMELNMFFLLLLTIDFLALLCRLIPFY